MVVRRNGFVVPAQILRRTRYAACLAVLVGLCLAIDVSASRVSGDQPAGPPKRTLGKPFACADYGGNKVCLVDKEGLITWQYAADRPMDVWVLANGNVLFSHVKGAMEVTRDKKLVWEYKTDEANEVHSCQPLPDGLVLVAESGPMRLREVGRDGRIVREVALKTECRETHLQMRGVRKLANGHYLVGQYQDGAVREYDAEGKVVGEIPMAMPFGGIRLPDGHTLIGAGDAHRIVEVDEKGKVVWEVKENDLPGNPLRFVAGLQRLPNGNTLVCNWGGHGHIGEQPQIVEITRDKRVVGELYDFQQFNTISGIVLLDMEGDPSRFELLR